MRFASRYPITLAVLTALPLTAQIGAKGAPAAAPPATVSAARIVETKADARPVKISLITIYNIERNFDQKLLTIGAPNTVDLLGATRGLYLDGYGAVFTAEIGLVTPPAVWAFHPGITPQEKVQLHKSKLERLPKLRALVGDMMRTLATDLSLPEDQKIVVAVRLDYRDWEDTTGLPGMVMMTADRRSALAGNFTSEEQ